MRFLLPALVVGIVAFVWWWRKYGKTERVRNVVDPLKLRLPVFGELFQKLALARFARNLEHAARPPASRSCQSLDIVADTTGSVVITRALDDVRESVRRGESSPARWPSTTSSRRWSCR